MTAWKNSANLETKMLRRFKLLRVSRVSDEQVKLKNLYTNFLPGI